MILYPYTCPTCGQVEVRKPMAEAGRAEACPACASPLTRVWTPPVTDCRSFGKDAWGARTPEHRRRVYDEDQERQRFRREKEAGARAVFGPGGRT